MLTELESRVDAIFNFYRNTERGWLNAHFVFLFAAMVSAVLCTLAVISLLFRVTGWYYPDQGGFNLMDALREPYMLYAFRNVPKAFAVVFVALLVIQCDRHQVLSGITLGSVVGRTSQATWQRLGLLLLAMLCLYTFLSKPLFTVEFFGSGWITGEAAYPDGFDGPISRLQAWVVRMFDLVHQYFPYIATHYLILADRRDRKLSVSRFGTIKDIAIILLLAFVCEAIYFAVADLLQVAVFALVDVPFGTNIIFPGVFKLAIILLVGAYLLPILIIALLPSRQETT